VTQKVALVTGAGGGIGRATALALVRAGWSVTLTGRRREPLEATAALAQEQGARTLVHPADVGEEPSVEGLFAASRDRFGRLDLLFNNAGGGLRPSPIEDVPLAQWDAVVRTNLTGAFLCLRAAFRQMKAQAPQGGRIINNGSISAHTPRPGSIAYTATKHAVTGLTRQAALDGRAYDIACGQIDIGNAATDMTRAMSAGVAQADGRTAPEPVMDVDRVAEAVLYMAGLPLDANVLFMTVMATKMPFVGRG
jgi:NAD(P)-dependent dehydrogenase (short-subunit alcohol dehydrogenase family)